jgi:AcrR family transcriptional regulator
VPGKSTLRETLLDAAMRLLEQRGPGALRVRDVADAAEQSTMGVYTHFGSKQGLLEQLYLHGFQRLEERLAGVESDGQGREELLAFALAYRAFALDNEALYGLMFERATPDFVPSDASRMAGLVTFEMLVARVAIWRPLGVPVQLRPVSARFTISPPRSAGAVKNSGSARRSLLRARTCRALG